MHRRCTAQARRHMGPCLGVVTRLPRKSREKTRNIHRKPCQVLAMEPEKGEWGFKALKQLIKLLFSLRRYDEMLERYQQLLGDYTACVTQNVAEKGVNR
jgi:hypothetical protein